MKFTHDDNCGIHNYYYYADDKPKLRDAFRNLFELATHWISIGTLLGVEGHIIQRIKSEDDGIHEKLQEMLSEWLRQIDPAPTWKDLADVVERFDFAKAKEIRDHFAH